jgi:Na+-transporting NADH:ubiquinone oxidoreductase subunit C
MKNKYVFIVTIAIVCSLVLSLAAEGLKERTNKNIEIDIKKNILNAIGVNINNLTILDMDKYFNDNIDTLIIDMEGNIANLLINDLNMIENKQTGEVKYFNDNQEYLPLYKEIEKNIIIIPVSGKGLWSTLFGYFAIDANNYSTVKGITFYNHGETPGLGAEIASEWFQLSFVGKEIYSEKELLSIKLTKPGLADKNNLYEVNGISGATITSNGVTTLLKRDLQRYEPYFKNKK